MSFRMYGLFIFIGLSITKPSDSNDEANIRNSGCIESCDLCFVNKCEAPNTCCVQYCDCKFECVSCSNSSISFGVQDDFHDDIGHFHEIVSTPYTVYDHSKLSMFNASNNNGTTEDDK
uniref:Uncharacterized protein n=1 Tax=Romanomermis culicivorax TaxID=13658 RepID=A0A915L1M6_ROMCU